MLSAISQKGRGVLNLKCYQYNLFAGNDPEFNWIWIAQNNHQQNHQTKSKAMGHYENKNNDIYDQTKYNLQILHEVAGILLSQLSRQLKLVFNRRLSFRTLRRRYTVPSNPSERISSNWELLNRCNPLT